MTPNRRKGAEGLAVRPVKAYRVPKYPSHADPNPLLVPERVAYPGCREVAAALAGLGILGAAGAASAEGADSTGAPENPFSAERLVPIHVRPQVRQNFIAFGVGAPAWPRKTEFTRDEAAELIESVFRSEGFAARDRQWYRADGVEATLDGFDAERGIGFAFYEGETSAADLRNMYTQYVSDFGPEHGASIFADSLGLSFGGRKEGTPDEQAKKLESAIDLHVSQRQAQELSVAEARLLEGELAKRKTFVMVVGANDPRLKIPVEDYPLSAVEKLQIESIPDWDKRRELEMKLLQAKDAKATKVALEELERAVRQYIRWARSQGLQ